MKVGIIGDGQLARMMALAGLPLGIEFSFLADTDESRCVKGLGSLVRYDQNLSAADVYNALQQPDVITVEKEHVDTELLKNLAAFCDVRPAAAGVEIGKNRHAEKQLLDKLNIPTANYRVASHAADVSAAVESVGFPVVVKSCEEGYDGRNQWVIKNAEDQQRFDSEAKDGEYLIEEFVPFDREVSIVAVRAVNGDFQHYAITENQHNKGILIHSVAPSPHITQAQTAKIRQNIEALMNSVDYVGVMAMECFIAGEKILVNEIAPRVHNSGHWTQSGAATCQFENHIRAITGMALGSTKQIGITGMVNLLGTPAPPIELIDASRQLHWYNKLPRPGRKLGHINVSADSHSELQTVLADLVKAVH